MTPRTLSGDLLDARGSVAAHGDEVPSWLLPVRYNAYASYSSRRAQPVVTDTRASDTRYALAH